MVLVYAFIIGSISAFCQFKFFSPEQRMGAPMALFNLAFNITVLVFCIKADITLWVLVPFCVCTVGSCLFNCYIIYCNLAHKKESLKIFM